MTFPRSTLSVLIALLFSQNAIATSLYQEQGNLIRRGTQTFSFDQANRLRSAMGKANYYDDSLDRRVKIAHADGSTQYIYLRHSLIAEVVK